MLSLIDELLPMFKQNTKQYIEMSENYIQVNEKNPTDVFAISSSTSRKRQKWKIFIEIQKTFSIHHLLLFQVYNRVNS